MPGLVDSPATATSSISPTIGIVVALPEEHYANRVMLTAPVRYRVHGDPADYVLATMASNIDGLPHRVVLTMTGDIGTTATANACANLVRSFETISHLVMTGIAAGVPSWAQPDRHVRLGDIVSATAGIVDYGHLVRRGARTEPRQPFPRPSPLLVRADRSLESDEHGGLRPWEAFLDVTGNPELAGFGRPPDETDVIRDRGAGQPRDHPSPAVSGHRSGAPKVHRGRIGSADVSLRSATTRDRLASRLGVLAFEMEAAGIGRSGFLHGLEWFVVRGISDYGDEYADRTWRRYAALAAAAYLRALLGACPPVAPRGGYPLAAASRTQTERG